MKSRTVLIPVVGLFLGAASWGIVSLVSDRFEPFDSSRGFYIGQLLLSIFAFGVGYLHGIREILMLIFGAYMGMNLYSYLFGSSEQRVWFGLGLITTLSLIVYPLLFGFIGQLVGVIRSRVIGNNARKGQPLTRDKSKNADR